MGLKEVYHSSQTQGITELKPNISSHNENWVYATKDMAIAAAFLGTEGGDFTCAVGRDENTGKPFICERFKGAFDLRYLGVSGSIYVLPGDNFKEGCTQWEEEVVCSQCVKPIHEICITNAKLYLLDLTKDEVLIIKYFPDKIAYIPEDDEDLVFRATIWYKQFGDKIIDQVKQYHPALLDRVWNAIKTNKY
jgi:hypothetical protein